MSTANRQSKKQNKLKITAKKLQRSVNHLSIYRVDRDKWNT